MPFVAVGAGLVIGVVFVRRQFRLTDPMLDLGLFSRPAFGMSLGAQTMGLFVLTGTQFLILQYFQLVLGLPPLEAGLWALPAMTAGVVGTLLAPAAASRIRPGWVMAGGFAFSVAGLVMIAQVTAESGLALAAVGFSIPAFGISAALALTNDVIISSVPRERAGSASGIGETGAELGNALGVAVAGSVAAAVYRSQMDTGSLPAGMRPDLVEAARSTLGGANGVARQLPGDLGAELLAMARSAFTHGVRVAALVEIGILALLAVMSLALLRRPAPHLDEAELLPPQPELPDAVREVR
jgi:DHA2 family multidrug resistance protein-like MFS transporter